MNLLVRLCTASAAALLLAHSPLASAHCPGEPEHQIAQLGDLQLEDGGVIKNLKVSYVTHGTLSAAKDNAILVLHGFGSNTDWRFLNELKKELKA